ncbi:MAG: hypothetical protein ACI8SE_000219 [Bacteroidia bacterium]|jgi:hypothetical protein
MSSINSFSQTTVSSIISSNQTWTAAGSPYMVTGNVLIESGVKITIEPGTKIKTTGGLLRIIVDGTLEAIGKKDSVIVADSVAFEFTSKCVGYDVSTGNGSQFQYVLFRGADNPGVKTIDLKGKSMLVKNCKFLEAYYYIYAYSNTGDTTDLIVSNTVFQGSGYSSGYMVYCSGNVRLQISDCYADNIGGIIVGKWTTIKKSTFKNFSYSSGIRQTSGLELILECNLFQNFRYTILDLSYPNANSIIEVRENTFDTSDVLVRMRGGASYTPKKLEIKNNNFLHYNTNSIQVSIGSNPGVADTLNLTKNYWGTSTKADIELGIKDFLDDITIAGYIDFSTYLTSQVKTCSKGGTIGGADTSGINTGIKTMNKQLISVFPNPANTQLNIEADGKLIQSIRILDLKGQTQIIEIYKTTSPQVDVSNLIDGIYFIEVSGDDFVSRNKLIVKH